MFRLPRTKKNSCCLLMCKECSILLIWGTHLCHSLRQDIMLFILQSVYVPFRGIIHSSRIKNRQDIFTDLIPFVLFPKICLLVCLMAFNFNATFNNISAISWRSVLLVDETRGPGENHRPVSSHWQCKLYHIVIILIKDLYSRKDMNAESREI